MYETLLYEVKEGVAHITLNRPENYNAFNQKMSEELLHAFKSVRKDDSARVVVLTGAGEKAFCSGQDLKEIKNQTGKRSLGDSVEKRYNPVVQLMADLAKPIICRLNGVAAGAGCSFALACDIVVAAENASLIEVFVNVGLVLDSGSSFFMPRLVGMKRAFELCTMGSKIKAAEALELGLVNRVVAKEQLDEEVQKFTDFYAKAPTKAIGMIKKMLYKSTQSNLKTMLQYEAYCQEIAGSSDDYQEGVAAFNEKRKPVFEGK